MGSSRDEEASSGTGITISAEDSIHSLTVRKTCAALFRKNQFVDVTLSCKDGQLQAHRLILSSASPYLYNLFTSTSSTATPCTQPIIILRNSCVADVQSALEFIYSGKTRVSKSKLSALMEVGQDLGCNLLKKAIDAATDASRQEILKLKQATTATLNQQEPPHPSIQFQFEDFNSQVRASLKRSNDSTTIPVPKLLRMSTGGTTTISDRRSPIVLTTPDRKPHQDLTWMSSGSKALAKAKNSSNWNTKAPECQTKARISLLKSSACNSSVGGLAQQSGVSGQEGSSSSSSSKLQLQHDKGESFVYTNENLGMMLFDQDEDDDDDEEDDPDESEEELKTTLPVSHLPQISVKPVKDFKSNGNSDTLPRFDLIKTEQQQEEDGEVPCPWCMQVFKNLANLQVHIKTHVTPNGNYKPYTCEYCQHEFGRSAHLKRHLRTHTGEKPYECLICRRVFSRQDKMKTHVKKCFSQGVQSSSSGSINNSMTITSYPPPSLSQSSGGQVPIKILIPTGHGTHNQIQSSVSVTKHELSSQPPTLIKQEAGDSSSPVGSPSAFFSDAPGPSLTINASPNLKMPTLTPQTALLGKNLNFPVN